MDSSSQQLYPEPRRPVDRFRRVRLFLIGIWNPTKADGLSIEEFDYEHRSYVIQVLAIWKVKWLVIVFNLFTCLIFTIEFSRASYILTALLSISMPWIDKYTWIRYIVNGFLTHEPKYFNYFFITFAIHIAIFIAWTAGLLWNSIGWYLLLIDPKNYGFLLSSLIIFNSGLLTLYSLMICAVFVKLVQHIYLLRAQFDELNANEFQRLIHNVNSEFIEV